MPCSRTQTKHPQYRNSTTKTNLLPKYYSLRFKVLFHYFGHFEVENGQKKQLQRTRGESEQTLCSCSASEHMRLEELDVNQLVPAGLQLAFSFCCQSNSVNRPGLLLDCMDSSQRDTEYEFTNFALESFDYHIYRYVCVQAYKGCYCTVPFPQ